MCSWGHLSFRHATRSGSLRASTGLLGLVISACVAAVSAEPDPSRPITELIAILASSEQAHADKWAAVQALRQHGTEATPHLVRLLDESGGNARYYAIRTLGYVKDPAATQALCRVLLDRSYGPRRYAAIALGQIADPSALEALRSALNDAPHVATDALDALVKIDSLEARGVLEKYHCGGTSDDLRVTISINKSDLRVGDEIRVQASLTNVSGKHVLVSLGAEQQSGYLLFQRKDGAFIEHINTGLRDTRKVSRRQLRELRPGETIECLLSGRVAVWSRGEKEDHAFVVSGPPFLTLDFGVTAFHVRRPGDYCVRFVFAQRRGLLDSLRAQGLPDDRVDLVWQGKVVSNSLVFSVSPVGTDSRPAEQE